MADIKIECKACNKEFRVSEFSDGNSCICPSCGADNEKPVAAGTVEKKKPLKLRPKKATGDTVTQESYQQARDASNWNVREQITEDLAKDKKRSFHYAGSWILFILLGTATGLLRYGGFLHADNVARIQMYGPFVILAFHVIIVLKAFKDSVFQGIFCLLIPMYSVYYIFLVSDDFYMRAVLAGLLVGAGEDTALFLNEKFHVVIGKVNDFIQTGGGSVR